MKGLKEYEEMFEMIFLQLTIYSSFTLSFNKIIQNFNNIHLDEISLQTETNTVFCKRWQTVKKCDYYCHFIQCDGQVTIKVDTNAIIIKTAIINTDYLPPCGLLFNIHRKIKKQDEEVNNEN